MHHDTLDDFVVHPDHRRLFEETRAHLVAYLDSVLVGHDDTPQFVSGFVEPCINPMGVSFHAADLSNLKYFVRCLNDVIIEWCDVHAHAWYIDANETASMIGKNYADDGPIAHYAHRIPFDPYDDWVERDEPVATVPVVRSFDIRSSHFYEAIVRDVCTRLVVLSGREQVKAVIVDLDNTLWRGLASDQVVGSWNGRPQGIVEALKILQKRGVLLAVASKNDEAYIRTHWDRDPAGLLGGAARLLAQPGRLRRRAHRLPPQVGHGRRDPRRAQHRGRRRRLRRRQPARARGGAGRLPDHAHPRAPSSTTCDVSCFSAPSPSGPGS